MPGPEVAFISRHGVSHNIPPSEVNARANIAALKSIGVEAIVAFSAVGSLREEIAPGASGRRAQVLQEVEVDRAPPPLARPRPAADFIIPTQIIDRTKGIRPSTFFSGLGVVAHVWPLPCPPFLTSRALH